ncbi:serine/threonine protein kinase [Candidatus Uabimicrobium sp. HlEnr_7]|uniref:serine/threonine protein kinase n=1 Tax=Candidatus Uabimicrobium helgolandensis TaxID=3095367 RepID=UPI0035566E82
MDILKGRYDIKYMFEQGGMSKIYKALDLFFDQMVAVKEICIPEEEKEYELELRKRLQREYRLLGNLQHENIVKAIDFFEENDTLYLVLELVDGEPLDKLLGFEEDTYDLKYKVNVAIQLASAVKTINDAGIVHRDIKPSNIIIDSKTGKPKVLDLGIGKPLEADNFTQLTIDGSVLGTVDYMSPEQLRGDTDLKTDAFSLGITFYQFFLWEPKSPFYHSDVMTCAQKIIAEQVPLLVSKIDQEELEQHNDTYQSLSTTISGMLIKEPMMRTSLEKVIEDLNLVYQSL